MPEVPELLERKAYDALLKWKLESAGTTALLVEGARCVGKTTLVSEFGRREYRSLLLVDFATAGREVKGYFSSMAGDLDSLFRHLSAHYGVELYERGSLIVFDEVQCFPLARQLVSRLVADGRYDYIQTSSLLSLRERTSGVVLPSEEWLLCLRPLDFEEFLWALGEGSRCKIIARERAWPDLCFEGLHRRLSRFFRAYMLIGGMPAVVADYARNESFSSADALKREILELYRREIGRITRSYGYKVMQVFERIPDQLSKHEKKFALSSISKEARARSYERAFSWLADAGIVNRCYPVTDPALDLPLTRGSGAAKCYMADTGLLMTHAFPRGEQLDSLYRRILLCNANINEGMLAENAVAQVLRAQGDLFFYSSYDRTTTSERMEIDFLLVKRPRGGGERLLVSPVDVKPGRRCSTLSLRKFKEKFGERVGAQYVVHPKQLRVEGDRVFLPFYMAHLPWGGRGWGPGGAQAGRRGVGERGSPSPAPARGVLVGCSRGRGGAPRG